MSSEYFEIKIFKIQNSNTKLNEKFARKGLEKLSRFY